MFITSDFCQLNHHESLGYWMCKQLPASPRPEVHWARWVPRSPTMRRWCPPRLARPWAPVPFRLPEAGKAVAVSRYTKYTYVYIYVYIYICVCMYTYLYIYMYLCIYLCIVCIVCIYRSITAGIQQMVGIQQMAGTDSEL